MKFAVTGASGYVGSRFLKALFDQRIDHIGLSRSPLLDPLLSGINITCLDYYDNSLLKSALKGVDIVVHFAGLAHKKLPQKHSRRLLHNANVDCLSRVCEASYQLGVSKIVYISSIGVLGASTNGRPFDDSSLPNPHNLYAESKYNAELLLAKLASIYCFDYIILRPPLIYGERCPGNLAKLIQFLKFAPFVPFGELNNLRSLISVDNLISAVLAASFSPATLNSTYVLSDCNDMPFSSLVLALLDGLGRSSSRLVSCDPGLLSVGSRLLGKAKFFDQLNSELVVDASRFGVNANWTPRVHPNEALRATSSSFL